MDTVVSVVAPMLTTIVLETLAFFVIKAGAYSISENRDRIASVDRRLGAATQKSLTFKRRTSRRR